MAAVYKSLSKSTKKADDTEENNNTTTTNGGFRKNKQRVLILSSRGVTYRYIWTLHICWKTKEGGNGQLQDANYCFCAPITDTGISSTILQRCSPTAAKTSSSTPSPSFTN